MMAQQLASDASAAPRRLSSIEIDALDAALESAASAAAAAVAAAARGSRKGARSTDSGAEAMAQGKALKSGQSDQGPQKGNGHQSGGLNDEKPILATPKRSINLQPFDAQAPIGRTSLAKFVLSL